MPILRYSCASVGVPNEESLGDRSSLGWIMLGGTKHALAGAGDRFSVAWSEFKLTSGRSLVISCTMSWCIRGLSSFIGMYKTYQHSSLPQHPPPEYLDNNPPVMPTQRKVALHASSELYAHRWLGIRGDIWGYILNIKDALCRM